MTHKYVGDTGYTQISRWHTKLPSLVGTLIMCKYLSSSCMITVNNILLTLFHDAAAELDAVASSLNSGDSFVLLHGTRRTGGGAAPTEADGANDSRLVQMWHGCHSSEQEREMAAQVAERLAKGADVEVIEVGWAAGGVLHGSLLG